MVGLGERRGRRGASCPVASSSGCRWPWRWPARRGRCSWTSRRRRSTWPAASRCEPCIRSLRDEGCCIVLTTHELEEAERLADPVVIVDGGRLVATGHPAELSSRRCRRGDPLRRPPALDVAGLGAALGGRGAGGRRPASTWSPRRPEPAAVAELTAWLADHDLPLADLRAGRRAWRTCSSASPPRARPTPAPAVEPARHEAGPGPLAQTRVEMTLTLRRGESLLLDPRHPRAAARLLQPGRRAARPASDEPDRLPGPRHPGPGRHVDGHGQPRHRHGVRAPVRRAQAPGRHAARPARACWRPRPRRSCWSRSSRSPCWCPVALLLGLGPPRAAGALALAGVVLGTVAFAGIGLLAGGDPAGRGEPGRGQRALPRAAAARRDGDPARPPPGPLEALAKCLPSAPCPRPCAVPSPRA